MPTVASAPQIHPLSTYEPRSPQGGSALIPGQRPAGQLSLKLWTAPPPDPSSGTELDEVKVRAVLAALVEVYGGSRPVSQVRRALDPQLYQQLASRRHSTGQRYMLKTAHARQPADGTVEACGLVHNGNRALAMCARFQEDEHGWLCTEFEILEPR